MNSPTRRSFLATLLCLPAAVKAVAAYEEPILGILRRGTMEFTIHYPCAAFRTVYDKAAESGGRVIVQQHCAKYARPGSKYCNFHGANPNAGFEGGVTFSEYGSSL